MRLDLGPEARTQRIFWRNEGPLFVDDEAAATAALLGPGVTAGEELLPLSSGEAVPLISLCSDKLELVRGRAAFRGK